MKTPKYGRGGRRKRKAQAPKRQARSPQRKQREDTARCTAATNTLVWLSEAWGLYEAEFGEARS